MRKNDDAKNLVFLVVMLSAIVAFEIFNFTTTQEVLDMILGQTQIMNYLTLGTLLALGACAFDFGGLGRMLTTEQDFRKEPREVMILFVGWLLAAVFNAFLTWVAVMFAFDTGGQLPSVLAGKQQLVAAGIAVFVFVIRFILIFGFATFSDKINLNFDFLKRKKGSKGLESSPNPPTLTPRPVFAEDSKKVINPSLSESELPIPMLDLSHLKRK